MLQIYERIKVNMWNSLNTNVEYSVGNFLACGEIPQLLTVHIPFSPPPAVSPSLFPPWIFQSLIPLHLFVFVSSHHLINHKLCVSARVWLSLHICMFLLEENVRMYRYVCVTPSVCLLNLCVCAANELHVDGTLSLPGSHLNDWCM